MSTLILIDGIIALLALIMAAFVRRAGGGPRRVFRRVLYVLAAYSVSVTGIFLVANLGGSNTLYGAVFYGCIISGFHILAVGVLVVAIAML